MLKNEGVYNHDTTTVTSNGDFVYPYSKKYTIQLYSSLRREKYVKMFHFNTEILYLLGKTCYN